MSQALGKPTVKNTPKTIFGLANPRITFIMAREVAKNLRLKGDDIYAGGAYFIGRG